GNQTWAEQQIQIFQPNQINLLRSKPTMSNIAISNLRPAGADLFQDSENFLHELTEQEIADVLGGARVIILFTALCFEW
ncbi:MAG: hypothetical protein KME52_26255, partial [Desmonostoc geniculatum HA4340-LM1]|nr:hypothetical protein [Desmonostoc geniculatum HA4340-LM1]